MEGEREMSLEGRVVASGTVGERGRGPEQGNGWRERGAGDPSRGMDGGGREGDGEGGAWKDGETELGKRG